MCSKCHKDQLKNEKNLVVKSGGQDIKSSSSTEKSVQGLEPSLASSPVSSKTSSAVSSRPPTPYPVRSKSRAKFDTVAKSQQVSPLATIPEDELPNAALKRPSTDDHQHVDSVQAEEPFSDGSEAKKQTLDSKKPRKAPKQKQRCSMCEVSIAVIGMFEILSLVSRSIEIH